MADKKQKEEDSRDIFEKALDGVRDNPGVIPLATAALGARLVNRADRRYWKGKGASDKFARTEAGLISPSGAIFGGAAGIPLAAAAARKRRK